MDRSLRVEPHLLAASGREVVGHAHDAFHELSAHETGLADAAERWVGSSAAALSEVTERWTARHATHLEHARALGEHMNDAARLYADTDGELGAAVEAAASGLRPEQLGL